MKHLKQNGRMTNTELATAVNVSPATCHRRTQRLFAEGYVRRGAGGDLAEHDRARRAGDCRRGAGSLDAREFAAFEAAIAKLPFVLDCHLVAGDFDYFLKIRVHDIADFNRLHGERLIGLPSVRQTRTFFVMKQVVDNAPLDF